MDRCPWIPAFAGMTVGLLRLGVGRLRLAFFLRSLRRGGADFEGEFVVLQMHPHFAAMNELAEQQFFGERSEEHTSELQSLMRNSYAVFCLKNKTLYKATHMIRTIRN